MMATTCYFQTFLSSYKTQRRYKFPQQTTPHYECKKLGPYIFVKITNKLHIYRLIYYSKSALNVSGDIFANHQEHLSVFTVSDSVHPSCCRLMYWIN
jgi:hypothetical protein